jgi:hypothetical protein
MVAAIPSSQTAEHSSGFTIIVDWLPDPTLGPNCKDEVTADWPDDELYFCGCSMSDLSFSGLHMLHEETND